MQTRTKKDFIDKVAARTNQKRSAVKETVQCFLDLIIEELEAGNRLEFRDFGVYETKTRAARVAQNPKTLERVEVPAKTTVKFKVGRQMRERVELGAARLNDAPARATQTPEVHVTASGNHSRTAR